ncbi:MAG: response regulator [Proteobacteria bacterium]|nr:MAG: response regulator [Pseudomonadota bacterium]
MIQTRRGQVYVVDDEEPIRRSLGLLLKSAGFTVQVFETASAFLAAAMEGLPFGCLLLDVRMPGMDGMALQTVLTERGIRYPTVIVTAHGDVALAVSAMKAGASDFLEKPYTASSIIQVVENALARGDEGDARSSEAADAAARIAALSARETEVLLGLVAGKPNKIIAFDLQLSTRTVEFHRANLMEKLAVRSLSEAVRLALAAGIWPRSGNAAAQD